MRTVRFSRPFILFGLDGTQPPGDYLVHEDEEEITGLSWLAYRRISTLIEISRGSTTSMFSIDGVELESAIQNDQAVSDQRH
ncbi:hypothetical protein [Rhizobium sp. SL86]|uniref:hypothetical protein n=1 Tax=Rhizobium sp. SL86 TaxID=2995148 RepID=UPI00227476DA|nr:hypothetical protein [Rhizobium sp. SL86]MCY1667692.1 hypothetical protein [Rhizobium sp. SL86]